MSLDKYILKSHTIATMFCWFVFMHVLRSDSLNLLKILSKDVYGICMEPYISVNFIWWVAVAKQIIAQSHV